MKKFSYIFENSTLRRTLTFKGMAFCLFLGLSACATKSQAPASSSTGSPSTQNAMESGGVGEVRSFYEGTSANLVEENPEAVEAIIGEEVEEEINKAAEDEAPQFDIPIVINAKVEKWMNYFTGRGRKFFARWLSRSGRYIPMMQKILRENGLPEDLVYLAMIESGFTPYAYSRAKATGPWQFMKRTGSNYGLKVNWWIDERRDPEKSTIAAAAHLKDLYDQFNSWYLAAAGYNAGAGKITRAIGKYSTEDFWEMSKGSYLKPETKNYVPKLIAAALIAKEPEKYGFTEIEYHAPIEYDKVLVPEPTELKIIAAELGVSHSELKELNPELSRGITPPNYPNYELKIPVNHREKFLASYDSIRKKSIQGVTRHVVSSGENLWTISRKHGVTVASIKSFNNLQSSSLRVGQQLAIPVQGSYQAMRLASFEPPAIKGSNYRVQRGDSLWSISRKFNVTVAQLRSWNQLSPRSILRPGQRLRVTAPGDTRTRSVREANESGWKIHRVRRGESLWTIAQAYGVKVSQLNQWNELQSNQIRPGQKLRVGNVGL